MKRKRGSVRSKAPVVASKGAFSNTVSLNTREDLNLYDSDNAECESRMRIETRQNGCNGSQQQAGLQKQKVVDMTMEDSMSSFSEMNADVSANLSNIVRSIVDKSSGGFSSSSIKPGIDAEQVQNGRTHQEEQIFPQQDLQYKEQELKAALGVIRKVMKMDAAEPFNVPVDPIALGIPDYFDVIDTPMDFGAICYNLENGVKYKNSEDVLRDVQYVWDNCCMYNKKGHYILELMKRVKKNFTKFWREAGLFREQQQEVDGHSHITPTKSTMRCSLHGQRNLLGFATDYARHRQQDQADLKRLQPQQPSLSYSQTYHPQERPCRCQLSSGLQQTSKPRSGNIGSARHSHLTPIEAVVRRSPRGHKRAVDPMDDSSTHQQEKQPGPSQFQLQQHQSSLGHSHPCQPHQRSCQCLPSCQELEPPNQQSGILTASEGHLPPMESTVRQSPHGHRCLVGHMADNSMCLHWNHMGSSQPQLHQHQPSVSCSQPYQPQQGSCQCSPNSAQQKPSQPLAGTDTANAGDLSSPPEESMTGLTNHGPACTMGPVADVMDNVSHQVQDQIAPSCRQSRQPTSRCAWQHQPQHGTLQGQLSSSPPQPSQTPACVEMGGAGNFYSPPPGESMIRSTKPKRQPKFPACPMTDYISHHEQGQISPSQMQPHQSSSSYGQPHHSQQGACQGQLSSNHAQPSQPQVGMDMGAAASRSLRRSTNGRGPTRCLNLWNMEGKISVVTNELGQPIGLEAPKLINFLGTIARNGHIAPLTFADWRALPDENKEKMWQQVQSKFDVDPKCKSWILKSLGKKWKDWKAQLKLHHYNPHETDEERLADRDERVLPDQWQILISFWNSKESKERTVTNKANRSQQKMNHTAGTKSFAQVCEEQRAKRPDGKEPSQAELFILTRTRKDGRPVNEASSAIISQLREPGGAQQQETSQNSTVKDDVFFQVMGKDRHGRAHTYGLAPSPSDIGGQKPSRAEATNMVSAANAEVHEMKERLTAMEKTCAKMAAQMATMMSMMSAIHRKNPGKHVPSVVVSSNSEGSQQLHGQSSSFQQGVPSLQKSTTKRGRTNKQNTSVGKGSIYKKVILG